MQRLVKYRTDPNSYARTDPNSYALQLPRPAGEYVGRIEFDLAPVKENIRISRGMDDAADWFQPVARDNPDLGFNGGGSQLLLESVQPPVSYKKFGTF